MAGLIEIDEARGLVLAEVSPLPAEDVALADALGRVLAEDVVSGIEVPGFDNSAMDGYAVRAGDTAGASGERPARLRVIGESRAGAPASTVLGAGEAIAVSTGAALPDGADAIVRVEDTHAAENGVVDVLSEVVDGCDVRRSGEDIAAGATILAAGTPVSFAALGVLASIGRTAVRCAHRPRAALLCTGDELRAPGEPLPPGGVYNSNAHSLAALLETSGAAVASSELVADDRAATASALEKALDADVVVVCGGVSVGEHDHVRPAFAALGFAQRFWGVALRPGKPTWFGARGSTLAFGLPGNPVSAVVTFLLFVRPALLALQGADPQRARTEAVLDSAYEKPPGRAHAARCRLTLRDDGWHAEPMPRQGSHVLTSMIGADCLALIPTAGEGVAAGERVAIELLPSWTPR